MNRRAALRWSVVLVALLVHQSAGAEPDGYECGSNGKIVPPRCKCGPGFESGVRFDDLSKVEIAICVPKRVVRPNPAPELVSPPDGAVEISTTVDLTVKVPRWASGVRLTVCVDAQCTGTPLHDETKRPASGEVAFAVANLPHATTLYWRVQGVRRRGVDSAVSMRSFTTVAAPVSPSTGMNVVTPEAPVSDKARPPEQSSNVGEQQTVLPYPPVNPDPPVEPDYLAGSRSSRWFWVSAKTGVLAPPSASMYDEGLNGLAGFDVGVSKTWRHMALLAQVEALPVGGVYRGGGTLYLGYGFWADYWELCGTCKQGLKSDSTKHVRSVLGLRVDGKVGQSPYGRTGLLGIGGAVRGQFGLSFGAMFDAANLSTGVSFEMSGQLESVELRLEALLFSEGGTFPMLITLSAGYSPSIW